MLGVCTNATHVEPLSASFFTLSINASAQLVNVSDIVEPDSVGLLEIEV
jgi:hypothetical protein